MRRIYESEAIERDDEDHFAPNTGRTPTFRGGKILSFLGGLVVPQTLARRAVSVSVATPEREFVQGDVVPFRVSMKNPLPFPVTIETLSPVLWTWDVDGLEAASHVPTSDPPPQPGTIRFARGERFEFDRRWHGMFRTSETEWEPAEPGEYTIGAGLNVTDERKPGLYDSTTVRIRRE